MRMKNVWIARCLITFCLFLPFSLSCHPKRICCCCGKREVHRMYTEWKVLGIWHLYKGYNMLNMVLHIFYLLFFLSLSLSHSLGHNRKLKSTEKLKHMGETRHSTASASCWVLHTPEKNYLFANELRACGCETHLRIFYGKTASRNKIVVVVGKKEESKAHACDRGDVYFLYYQIASSTYGWFFCDCLFFVCFYYFSRPSHSFCVCIAFLLPSRPFSTKLKNIKKILLSYSLSCVVPLEISEKLFNLEESAQREKRRNKKRQQQQQCYLMCIAKKKYDGR
jgi:hypothetical protein